MGHFQWAEGSVNSIVAMLGEDSCSLEAQQHDNMPHMFLPLRAQAQAVSHCGFRLYAHISNCLWKVQKLDVEDQGEIMEGGGELLERGETGRDLTSVAVVSSMVPRT